MVTPTASPPKSLMRRALHFLRPHVSSIVFILLLTVSLGGLNAVEPLVFKYIFDGLSGGVRIVVHAIGFLLVIGLVREVTNALANWITWRTRIGVHYALLNATV